MSSKITPGPWRVDPVCRTLVVGTADPMPIIADTEVASIFDVEIDAADVEIDAANARLIAAAPEMLEALQNAREELRQAWACIEHIKETAKAYERKAAEALLIDIYNTCSMADAVIDKATAEEKEG